MLQTKIVELFRVLSKAQVKELKKWVEAPCYNTDKAVVDFYEYLASCHPRFDEKNVAVATMLKKIKGIKSENKLNQKATALMGVIEIFLINTSNDVAINAEIAILKTYKYLVLEKHFKQRYNKAFFAASQKTFKEPDDYYNIHLLEQTKFEGFSANTQRNNGNTINPVIDSLDIFYFSKKLRFLVEAANRHLFIGTPLNHHDAEIFLTQIAVYNQPEYPYIYCFYRVYALLSSSISKDVIKAYSELKVSLKAYKKHIHKIDYNSIINYMQNFCLRCINHNIRNYENDFLYWVDEKIAEDILLEKQLIQPANYRNIVAIAIKAGNITYAENFIEQFARFLPHEHKEAFALYTQALLAYAQKDYTKAEKIIAKTPNGDTKTFDALLKKLQLKCRYDNAETDTTQLLETIKNFESFLNYNKEKLAGNYIVLKKFSQYYQLLAKAQLGNNNVPQTITKLNTETSFVDKDWLLHRFESLAHKKSGKRNIPLPDSQKS
jgi:hypothetical protein